MGYIIGNRIVNTDKYYANKKNVQNALVKVPEFKMAQGISINKAQDLKSRIRSQAADISRTAPTFNDPRYTFTTLSIPTDLRTLNGLYRFFDDTDPIVGNAIRLHCLPPGSLILTANGIKPIEEITTEDKVIGKNGKYQHVLDTFSRQYDGKIYKIKVTGCPYVIYTEDHPILTCPSVRIRTRIDSDRKEPTKKLVWKQAKDITIDDYVVFPKWKEISNISTFDLSTFVKHYQTGTKPTTKIYDIDPQEIHLRIGKKITYPRFVQITKEFAELAGWYVAEGYVTKGGRSKRLRFALHSNEIEVAKRIQNLMKNMFGATSSIDKKANKNCIELGIGSRIVAEVFEQLFGTGAHNKRIHECILNNPNFEIVKEFLKAYIAGDGCLKNKYDISMITVSATLAQQLKLLGTKLGLFFNCIVKKNKCGNNEYTLRVTRRSALPILYGESIKQKKHPHYTYQDEQYFYLPVRRISIEDYTGMVYDIKTEDKTFLHNFIIHNCEFPLSGFGFSDCGDPGIKSHYEEMWDRIHGDQLLSDIALEYWRIGNVFPFGAWNEVDYMWDQIAILNPDYVTVDSTWLNDKPLIKLQPDEALKRIVNTGQPKFLYEQLSPEIIKYVRLGQEIPLDPNNTFFIAHNKAPYEVLGKSIIKRLLKMMIYEDRLNMANFSIATRQVIPITVVKLGDPQSGWIPDQTEIEDVKEMLACYDDQTEVLTEEGFKFYKDVKDDDKIGCFDPETKELQYHNFVERMEYDYDGEMVKFKTKYVDLLVTPNHKMYLKRYRRKDESWKFEYARDVKTDTQFCSTADWVGETPPKFIDIEGEKIPSEIFFEFMGWFLSEGSVCNGLSNVKNGKEYRYPKISIGVNAGEKVEKLEKVIQALPYKYNEVKYKTPSNEIHRSFRIGGEFAKYLLNLFPGGASKKYIPRWMLKADKKHLKILLGALVDGDGHKIQRKNNIYIDYSTASKQLANDVYEIAFKLGYVSTTYLSKLSEKNLNWNDSYRVKFSDCNIQKFPQIQLNYKTKTNPITHIPYKRKVWCFTVPTSLFIVRRNGKLSIQGNSREIDPNFSIIYHYGINIEFYGASGKILNVQPEMQRIIKLKFLGLGISEAMLSGGTATYATAYMNLEVLRQRYLHFQLRLENFVHKGLFEVVARLCGFYKTNKTIGGSLYKGKVYGDKKAMKFELEKRFASKTLRDLKDNEDFRNFIKRKAQESAENGLIVKPDYIYPRLKWDLLSLTSDAQYRQFLMAFDKAFPGVRKVSDSTYYRALKLDGDLEQRQIEVERQQQRERTLREAKRDKELQEKMLAEGLQPPPTAPGVKPPGGEVSMPGGALAPRPPTAPGGAPKAPVGKGEAEGEEEKPGGGPEILREKSKEIQEELEAGLNSEVKMLKKSNEELLKHRDTES